MWTDKREMDLTKMLDTPALALRASKFLLSTGELYQFRYLTKAQENDEKNDVTLTEDV